MTTKDEALKLALEALEEPKEHIAKHRRLEAITAIKEVLAQPEQEPVVVDQEHEEIEPCPSCGKPLQSALGGGVVCSDQCGYWFCF